MYINTYQRYKKSSSRIVKTTKQRYDEACKKEYSTTPTSQTPKVKPFNEEFKNINWRNIR